MHWVILYTKTNMPRSLPWIKAILTAQLSLSFIGPVPKRMLMTKECANLSLLP